MGSQTFDAFVRRGAIVRDRRSALAILSGALLATAGAPRGALANLPADDPHESDGPKGKSDCKGKDEKKKARKDAKRCVGRADQYCLQHLDPFTAGACAVDTEACCAFVAACMTKPARQCLTAVGKKYGFT
jgi:hypothetical protein